MPGEELDRTIAALADPTRRAVVGLLRHGPARSGELAEQLGYRSEAAFCRAFKRFSGVTPGSVRRAAG